MPIFWDSVYLAKWANFVNAMGKRYDNNTALHSVGITGGGMLGGTPVLANACVDKQQRQELTQTLTSDDKMNAHQMVEHWKYVADLFPRAFTKTRLNFDVDAPLDTKVGQNSL